ncbi:MAG: DUF3990 domain-containing protein [Streptococcaceae bacterium]|jgi:hypothetical protein|nr:DUF3990 domain-containing protein [Streptococcaceae bacterium]
MKVYHGTDHILQQPDPNFNSRRRVDFGRGFYTTSSKQQAVNWTKVLKNRNETIKQIVNVYDLDDEFLDKLSIKNFTEPSDEWFDLVRQCRNDHFPKEYDQFDIIIGPIADDGVATTFRLYETNVLTLSEAIARLKSEKLFNQVVFKSEKSFQLLTFIESIEVN